MRFVFFIILLLSSSFLVAQNVAPPPPPPPDSVSFSEVRIEARVDRKAWIAHLQKELQPIIENAARNGIKPGIYTVHVRFLVEKDGSISEVKALHDPGKGLGRGAEYVVKTGPKWNPAELNGKKVRSYHTHPITFVISEE